MVQKHFKKILDELVMLKDTSELMLDLAYSSVLFNSRELAEEVQKLEECVDKLHTDFEFSVLSSGFSPEESKDFLGLIRLGVVTEKIADAAWQIAEVVLRESEPHLVLKLAIKEAAETVTFAHLSKNSPLNNKTLIEARIPEKTGMWILAIKRGDKWIRPRPETAIKAGDTLIASGYAEGEDDFKSLASGKEVKRNNR